MLRSIILSIVFVFVSLFATAQTVTGKTIKIANENREVFMGARGGFYALSSTGTKTYLTDAQKASLGLTASTTTTKVSVPTEAQIQKEVTKEKVLIDNCDHVIYHSVKFVVETGARGGRFFTYVNDKGELKKHYLARECGK